MSNFRKDLHKKISNSVNNNYGIENYDEYRFGNYSPEKHPDTKIKDKLIPIKKLIKNISGYDIINKYYLKKADGLVNGHLENIKNLMDNLSEMDKELYLDLIAYSVLGYSKVKLARNTKEYWDAIDKAKSLSDPNDTYDPKFLHFMLEKFDLKPIGYDIQMYFNEIAVAIDFIVEQYAYKIDGKNVVSVEEDDVVFDIGGCWGDTSLYFAHKAGKNGKVYSFEFIPGNIKIFNLNISFNPKLKNNIELVEQPVSNTSGDTVYFKDYGPGSRVEFKPFEEQTGTTTTISIDDFVKANNVQKVDFIKMDIEGAEPLALEGAIETIKKFQPKLAIAIYHSMNDFVNIPNWILNLGLDYQIYIGHYTIHAEETMCFAIPKSSR
jgi:FkbM family methyltransferase